MPEGLEHCQDIFNRRIALDIVDGVKDKAVGLSKNREALFDLLSDLVRRPEG